MRFLLIGVLLLAVGYFSGLFFPIIKKIWTSSFVLVTSGWAFLVYAAIYFFSEIMQWKKGAFPWIVFGSNAIAIYILADVFETFFIKTGIRNHMMLFMANSGMYIKTASLMWSLFSVLVCWVVAWILYQKKIFIKL